MTRLLVRYTRRALLVLLGVVLVGAVWEGYKDWAPADGVHLFGTRLLPRASDTAMPHLSRIWAAFSSKEVDSSTITLGPSKTVFDSILDSAANSMRWATVGFVIGVVVGMLLALVMDRLRLAERALLPYIVLSQTVPLIALAPLVSGWATGLKIGAFDWAPWMSASVIAGYLAFFPVAVGMVRGLESPTAVHTEYFRCTAAGWWRTLLRLKLPASVPYLIPALRLAAAGAIVGTIVAEISTGLDGGIGKLIISYSTGASGDPSRVYAAVIGAAGCGLVAAAGVTLLDLALWRFQHTAVVR